MITNYNRTALYYKKTQPTNQWGSVESFVFSKKIKVSISSMTATQRINRGRNDQGKGLKVWSKEKLRYGDKLIIDDIDYTIVFVDDSIESLRYYEVEAIES